MHLKPLLAGAAAFCWFVFVQPAAAQDLNTIDFDNTDATLDGATTGTFPGPAGPVPVTLNSTDFDANGGQFFAEPWATRLGSNDVPGIGDPGVLAEGNAIDVNSGMTNAVNINFGGATITNPILLTSFVDPGTTLAFNSVIPIVILDQNEGAAMVAGAVLTFNGTGSANSGFAAQLTGNFTDINFNYSSAIVAGADSLAFTVAARTSLIRLGGREDDPVPTTTRETPAAPPAPAATPTPEPDPITILNPLPIFSASTSGQNMIAAVNGGTAATFGGFVNGIGARIGDLGSLSGINGVNGNAFRRPQQNLNIQIASADDRWTAAVHPFAAAGGAPLVVEVIESQPKWEIFTQGAFNIQDQNQIGLDPGFRSDSYTGTVGFERRLNDNLLVGFATTFGTNFVESGGNTGGADIDGVVLDAYALYAKDHFWTAFRYGAGFMDIDITRHSFPGVTATSDTESFNQIVSLDAGLSNSVELFGKQFIHGPHLGLDYTTGDIDAYSERGAGDFGLDVDGHAYSSLVSEVGWSIAMPYETNKLGRAYLQLRAGWKSEHLLDESDTDFTFQNSPILTIDPRTGEVLSRGGEVGGSAHNSTPQDDYASAGLHLTAYLGKQEKWTLGAGYQTQLFRSDFSEHYGYVRLGVSF